MIVTTVTSSPGIDTNAVIESTTDSGVEIKRIETQWEKVVTPGYALNVAVYQIVSRITTETNWEPFYYTDGTSGATVRVLSMQLNSRKTTTELLAGVPAATLYGQPWVQGGTWTLAGAILMTIEEIIETFTWGACFLLSSSKVTSQFYMPLALPSSSVYLYFDGSYRGESGGAAYTWREVMRDDTAWPDSPSIDAALRTPGRVTSSRWHQATLGIETYGVVSTSTPGSAIATVAPIATPAPPPTTGSSTIPQVFEEIILAEFDATDATNTTGLGGYTKVTQSPGALQHPENADELNAIAKRHIRRAMSIQYDISHNCIPFLRPGDHVALSNHARSLLGADAYVSATKRTANVPNGAMRQMTTIKIPPSWI